MKNHIEMKRTQKGNRVGRSDKKMYKNKPEGLSYSYSWPRKREVNNAEKDLQ